MYLILFDSQGERITSLCLGVHGDTMDELKALAKEYNPTYTLEGDDAVQALALGDVIFKDGKLVPRPPYVPTAAELKKQKREEIIQNYKNKFDTLKKAIETRDIMGLETESLKQQYRDLVEKQRKEISEV